jgi:hypothetical protein
MLTVRERLEEPFFMHINNRTAPYRHFGMTV